MERKSINDKKAYLNGGKVEDIIIKFDGKEFNVKFSQANFANVAVNEKIYNIELLKKMYDNVFSFAVNQQLLEVEMEFGGNGELNLTLDGFEYSVQVTNETRQLLEKFILDSAVVSTGTKIIKAPMPGMVIKILAQENQHVMEGDKLLVVEAMKMENVLKSPASGTVKSLKVKEGTPVNKDDVLLEIEVA